MLLSRIYPVKMEHIIVQPHQLPVHFERKPRINPGSQLNIGVVGAISYQKGSDIVIKMARILGKREPEAKVTVIGTIDRSSLPKNMTVTGTFTPSELPELIEKYRVNVCFFPSIWPETFSYVCSELMELDMPICAFNLGAQGERITNYPNGYIISEVSAEAAVKEIIKFFADLKTREYNRIEA